MSDTEPSRPARASRPPVLRVCPGGPLLVTGEVEVEDADGVRHRSTRPVSAVCRCGATSRAPWCDGTHKLLRPATGPRG